MAKKTTMEKLVAVETVQASVPVAAAPAAATKKDATAAKPKRVAASKAEVKAAVMSRVRKTDEQRKADRKARYEAKKTNPCLCGCGALVAGSFKQGHDQRVRGMMQRSELGEAKLPKAVVDAVSKRLLIKPAELEHANQPVLV